MKKVLILGGGFAGLSALQVLAKHREVCTITLVDRKTDFNFLPLLPDLISDRLESRYLATSFKELQGRYHFEFFQGEVTRIDLGKKCVYVENETLCYDYLLIASGSETNFYGNTDAQAKAFRIAGLADTLELARTLKEGPDYTWLIVGGGYTGVEIATQIRRFGDKHNKRIHINIIELSPAIVPTLTDWERKYIEQNLAALDIAILTKTSLKQIKDSSVTLTTGRTFPNAAIVWTAGVKAVDFLKTVSAQKATKGLLKVDQYLRVKDDCYAAGDTADFVYKGKSLPMLSSYSQQEGRHAARNIIRQIKNQQLKSFKPLELGYVVPMANGKACGNILGIRVKGWPALLIHYVSSAYRSYTLANRLGILKDVLVRSR